MSHKAENAKVGEEDKEGNWKSGMLCMQGQKGPEREMVLEIICEPHGSNSVDLGG